MQNIHILFGVWRTSVFASTKVLLSFAVLVLPVVDRVFISDACGGREDSVWVYIYRYVLGLSCLCRNMGRLLCGGFSELYCSMEQIPVNHKFVLL